ncbi:alpha/beta hydrolase family protein [Tumebacillus permanentifrigoris]|uniref:Serine aminopeptidase S33 family n=1 Tax=Tumebacillus permanentifrigoris TaxID=378543 RepID=A0A316DEI5_9BACL|nr:alpha/beta fold hydrolase [Tumebacillus permanentifrigoris]PWK16454.1 serine aminopeptidase S33 family [Tumebacillus permanentifrigoris]
MLSLLRIPSGDAMMVGRLFHATGAGTHPTLLLLHGFPGVQQNHDIAFALQRAGWNVLLINYRGAWGSHGTFSFVHALEDVQAALAYLRRDDVTREHNLDLSTLVLVGHSMGGFLACMTAADDEAVTAVASISGFNFGLVAEIIGDQTEAVAELNEMFGEAAFFLNGADGDVLTAQARAHSIAWNLLKKAPALAARPVLLLGADRDQVGPVTIHHDSLVEAFQKSGAKRLEHRTVDTDHNWVTAREELAVMLQEWLAAIRTKTHRRATLGRKSTVDPHPETS